MESVLRSSTSNDFYIHGLDAYQFFDAVGGQEKGHLAFKTLFLLSQVFLFSVTLSVSDQPQTPCFVNFRFTK